jgi:hypothetical protein
MASMEGVMNTFSTQTSMATAPINRDPEQVGVNKGSGNVYYPSLLAAG